MKRFIIIYLADGGQWNIFEEYDKLENAYSSYNALIDDKHFYSSIVMIVDVLEFKEKLSP